jgi:hypothetical protein
MLVVEVNAVRSETTERAFHVPADRLRTAAEDLLARLVAVDPELGGDDNGIMSALSGITP